MVNKGKFNITFVVKKLKAHVAGIYTRSHGH